MNKTENGIGAPHCTAFIGMRRVAAGELRRIVPAIQRAAAAAPAEPLLVFDAAGAVVELDLRGSAADVLRRLDAAAPPLPAAAPRGPGRPKLGVVGREVTLLPRHWDWLNRQPGGASVALRRLVDDARRANEGRDRVRAAQEAAYRFMAALAGALPGFEEATRALFAADGARFAALTADWPADVRAHAGMLAAPAFGDGGPAAPSRGASA